MKVYSVSLGCPKNRVDTEHFLGSLGSDVSLVPHLGRADVVFINTCGFILPAVQESVRTILDAVAHCGRLKRRPFLVVGGCLSGRYGVTELAKEIPEVDLWLDGIERSTWAEQLLTRLSLPLPPAGRLLSTPPSYAWLKISDGCRHHCAFCTIPAIRGRHRSLSRAVLREEASLLLERGVKELVLVAQDTTAWGEDIDEPHGLVSLLEELVKLDGLQRLRLMYLYPAGISKKLLSFIADTGAPVLPYFDIPLQHAHPEILQRMGRPFAGDPRKAVDRIRTALPEAALRTSLIVGFPGETEAHFKALCDFVQDMQCAHLGVFAYQPEEGTPAASFPNQLPDAVKEERRAAIMRIQAEISESWLSSFVGQKMEVLVDAPHPEWPGLHTGRVWFQAPEIDGVTYISGEGVTPGALVEANIEESAVYDLTALVE